MKATMELEVFAANCNLPEGMRFKEWDKQGCILAFKPDSERGQYIDTKIAAIERVSDGKYYPFELSYLVDCQPVRGHVVLSISDLASAVDKAIAELEK